jgi:hypothetical protein
MIYWTDRGSGTIERAYLDGSARQTIAAGFPQAQGIAVDPGAGKVYWAETATFSIFRSNLDGSDQETFLDLPFFFPVGLNFDPSARELYWTDPVLNSISRINVDTSIVQQILTALQQPQDIVIDTDLGILYWSESNSGISLADINGSNTQPYAITIPGSVQVLAINRFDRRLIWHSADRFTSAPLAAGIDEEFIREVGDVNGARTDPDSNLLYFTDTLGGRILSASPGGPETVILSGLASPWRIAIGPDTAPPVITTQPSSMIVPQSATMQLTVQAIGRQTLAYQWVKDAQLLTNTPNITGANASTLQIAKFMPEDIGAYSCIVSNPDGIAVSDPGIVALPAFCSFDSDGNGVIDVNDISAILFHIGESCITP